MNLNQEIELELVDENEIIIKDLLLYNMYENTLNLKPTFIKI